MATFAQTWLTAKPDGEENRNQIDNIIKDLKEAIQERLNIDHLFAVASGAVDDANTGCHRKAQLRDLGGDAGTVANQGTAYVKAGGDYFELFFKNSNGNVVQLTQNGYLPHSSMAPRLALPANATNMCLPIMTQGSWTGNGADRNLEVMPTGATVLRATVFGTYVEGGNTFVLINELIKLGANTYAWAWSYNATSGAVSGAIANPNTAAVFATTQLQLTAASGLNKSAGSYWYAAQGAVNLVV